MRSAFFIGLIVLFAIAVLYVIRPFFYPIFWAATIAVLFYPVYEGMLKHLKRPGMSAGLCVALVIVVILLPLALIGVLVVNESIDLYQTVTRGNLFTSVEQVATRLEDTSVGPYIIQIQEQWTAYAQSATKTISLFLLEQIKNITQNSLKFIFLLFMTLYTLFFLLKDGKRLLERIQHLSPLGNTYEEMLYKRFTSTTKATLKSTLIVGGVQGTLGGILFWVTGIEGALVWGIIMTALSIIPAIGSFIIWLPAGIIMLALGNVWQGLTILLVGALLISTIDNFLRPPLVGKDIQMHPLFVLFSTLGGLFLFGISGFIIGPVISALFLSIISIYDYYYKNELQKN